MKLWLRKASGAFFTKSWQRTLSSTMQYELKLKKSYGLQRDFLHLQNLSWSTPVILVHPRSYSDRIKWSFDVNRTIRPISIPALRLRPKVWETQKRRCARTAWTTLGKIHITDQGEERILQHSFCRTPHVSKPDDWGTGPERKGFLQRSNKTGTRGNSKHQSYSA